MQPMFAVHISDGLLNPLWLTFGFVVAIFLVAFAAWRVRDEEIPRIGLLTAAFFVASSIRVPLGVTSVHLLLTGLMGVVLGRRAPLAAGVGLFLQALLLGHGGYLVLGVNICVMTIPALLSWFLFPLVQGGGKSSEARTFAAGFVTGSLAVIATAGLNAVVLIFAGVEDWRVMAGVVFVVHLPVAAIEGIILGTTATYLMKVKPELLGITGKIGAGRTDQTAPIDLLRPNGVEVLEPANVDAAIGDGG